MLEGVKGNIAKMFRSPNEKLVVKIGNIHAAAPDDFTFSHIVRRVIELLKNPSTSAPNPAANCATSMICTKAGTAPQAVSNLFRHYYGQGLAREIELSPPKKQTVLIHKEIRSFGGIQNFPSLEATHAAAAHQFYLHGGQRRIAMHLVSK